MIGTLIWEIHCQPAGMLRRAAAVNDSVLQTVYDGSSLGADRTVAFHKIRQVDLLEHAVPERLRTGPGTRHTLVIHLEHASLIFEELDHIVDQLPDPGKIDQRQRIGFVGRHRFRHVVVNDQSAKLLRLHIRPVRQGIQPVRVKPPASGFRFL